MPTATVGERTGIRQAALWQADPMQSGFATARCLNASNVQPTAVAKRGAKAVSTDEGSMNTAIGVEQTDLSACIVRIDKRLCAIMG